MKQIILVFLLTGILGSCLQDNQKVLLFITDGSRDLKLMLTEEVMQMKEIMEETGFQVVIASLSGETIAVDSLRLKPDLRLEEVIIDDYDGFIFPCMAPQWDKIYLPNDEVVGFIESVVERDKPMAAQTLSVADFAKAGILVGREYAFTIDPDTSEYPEFKGGFYRGEGVVQNGMIITSGTCPWKTREYGKPDGTREMTELLIAAIRKSTQKSS
ncbi:MAG: DJ-1/PfpI family protein [Bacteroidales bacterium]|nr:DJ-1/PfpI family protein [Bacteroidales bacterium]